MSQKLHILLHLIIAISCNIFTGNGFKMKMIPIDSPELKILPHGFTSRERHQLLANISLSRILRHQSNFSLDMIRSSTYRFASSFFVTRLQFGTRVGEKGFYSPYVLIDTGTDLTWVQSDGCNPCFELNYENFHYKESTTFKRVPLNDPLCHPPSFNFEGSCGYSKSFGLNNPATHGLLGREDFYFKTSDDSQVLVFSGLLLGCGLKNENFDFLLNNGPHNAIAGIQGLGPGDRSIMSQLNPYVKGRFSYCLTPITKQSTSQSIMYFGDDAQISGDATRQVQTISMRSHGLYYLYLSGISLDGIRLPINPSIFEFDEKNFNKGFFIDSGTPYTILAESAYRPLKEAIVHYFRDHYGWNPEPSPPSFDLCYPPDPEYNDRIFPTVTLHFMNNNGQGEEVDMVLGKENMFEKMSEEYGGDDGFCMMIIETEDPGPCIFGSFQQVNFKILHDISKSALSFVPQNCLGNP